MSNYNITQYSYDKAKKGIDIVNSKQYLSANLLW